MGYVDYLGLPLVVRDLKALEGKDKERWEEFIHTPQQMYFKKVTIHDLVHGPAPELGLTINHGVRELKLSCFGEVKGLLRSDWARKLTKLCLQG